MAKVYYPITQYHILLSQIVRKKGDAIVLDEKIFTRALIERVLESGGWDQTFVISRKKGLAEFAGRFVVKSREVKELLSVQGREIVFFSYGYRYCVFVVNLLSKRNEVIMMEDGIAPYYMSDLREGWLKACESISMPYAYVFLWWANNIRTDSSFVRSLDVFNVKLLTREMRNSRACNQIERVPDDLEKNVDRINRIFDYREGRDTLCYDVVYFDTDFVHEEYQKTEFETICRLFSAFEGKRVLVKLRICGSGEVGHDRLKFMERIRDFYSGKMVLDVIIYDIPWEIAYMNNRKALSDAVFVCMGLSTVMITPNLVFAQEQSCIICQDMFLSDYFSESDLAETRRFVDRANQFSTDKKIHIPKTLAEMHEIVGRH
jgi:hypothetical protein